MPLSEPPRIADQLRRAFNGDAWHGPALRELLEEVTAEQAAMRPLPSAHTIRELAAHIDIYVRLAIDATNGIPMPKLFITGDDWLDVSSRDPGEWRDELNQLFGNSERLAAEIEKLPEAKLSDIVPGRDYDFYHLLHGIVQHSLYHGGQIAQLRKALG